MSKPETSQGAPHKEEEECPNQGHSILGTHTQGPSSFLRLLPGPGGVPGFLPKAPSSVYILFLE